MEFVETVAKTWHLLPHNRDAMEQLAKLLRVSPVVAQLLLNRGISEPERARRFLDSPMKGLHAPELLPGVCQAADRLMDLVQVGRLWTDLNIDSLDKLLSGQVFRLASWRMAADDINYRRFFDINELAALRVEEPAVFEATHRLLFELVASGQVTGVRVDHPDGLYDPAEYFSRLQRGAAEQLTATPGSGDAALPEPGGPRPGDRAPAAAGLAPELQRALGRGVPRGYDRDELRCRAGRSELVGERPGARCGGAATAGGGGRETERQASGERNPPEHACRLRVDEARPACAGRVAAAVRALGLAGERGSASVLLAPRLSGRAGSAPRAR